MPLAVILTSSDFKQTILRLERLVLINNYFSWSLQIQMIMRSISGSSITWLKLAITCNANNRRTLRLSAHSWSFSQFRQVRETEKYGSYAIFPSKVVRVNVIGVISAEHWILWRRSFTQCAIIRQFRRECLAFFTHQYDVWVPLMAAWIHSTVVLKPFEENWGNGADGMRPEKPCILHWHEVPQLGFLAAVLLCR